MTAMQFQVTGMTCGHCAMSVRGEVTKVAGVESVEVDVDSGRLVVDGAGTFDPAAVVAAVDEAGYSAAPVR